MTPDVAAEAAVWVARLHGPSRSPRMERECLAWQSRSAAHREAFERCTETWQDIPLVTVASAYASAAHGGSLNPPARVTPLRWAPALVLAVLAIGTALVFEYGHRDGVYATGVGEQQRVLLRDGSRMTLNTDTHVSVELDSSRRVVDMRDGEALFEVAKDPERPFVVRAVGTEVVAHGTAFSVRVTPEGAAGGPALTVTLLEGHVSVERATDEARGALAPAALRQMSPGERLRLTRAVGTAEPVAAAQVDRPNLESAVAWQRNEAAFDDVSLADAVAEMNRYNRTQIVLLQAQSLGQLRVSGLYRTGNSVGFARAVAELHGLSLEERQGRLELAKPQ